MFLISLILNLITIAIVGVFVFLVYLSYLKRPEPSMRPIDVMRDIVGGQAGHARIYKVAPYNQMLTGDTGEFVSHIKDDFSTLGGNMFNYTQGKKPWEGEVDANFGSNV